jgi:RHS repeat-associated protein
MESAKLPDGTLRRYSFDRDSNRAQVTENGLTTATYTYDPANPNSPGIDQLTSATESGVPRSFAYRSDGEMTSRGSEALTWDGWGRLTGGTFAGPTTVSYSFDPVGFRRQRIAGGTTTRYLHGGMFETDGTGAITLTDVDGTAGDLTHFAGTPTTGTTVTYLSYNGHGDLAAEVDSAGTRTNAYTYDPFGTPRQTQPTNKAIERFTGRWDKKLDTASSLIEMGARPYDPKLGRFLAVDPVDGGSFNTYDYARQDPVNDFDLSGLAPGCSRSAEGCGNSWAYTKSVTNLVLRTGCKFSFTCRLALRNARVAINRAMFTVSKHLGDFAKATSGPLKYRVATYALSATLARLAGPGFRAASRAFQTALAIARENPRTFGLN